MLCYYYIKLFGGKVGCLNSGMPVKNLTNFKYYTSIKVVYKIDRMENMVYNYNKEWTISALS